MGHSMASAKDAEELDIRSADAQKKAKVSKVIVTNVA